MNQKLTLDISNINKLIGKKHILNNISLRCESGKIFGLVGPNGCGKSSLFKVLSTLWNPTSGSIKINDLCLHKNKETLLPKIGAFIEMPNIYNDLSGKENLNILLKLYGIRNKDWYEFLLQEFDISNFMDKKVKTYSLGMRQKIGLIASLINNPDIVFLDEPTNSLDINTVHSVHNIINILKQNNKLVIVSSHILEELDSLVDKTFIMKSGRLIDTYAKHKDTSTYIEFNNKINLSELSLILDNIPFKEIDDFTIEINNKDINYVLKLLTQSDYTIKNISSNNDNLKSKFNELMEEQI
ncbi:ABC-type multidrug transport system, ATPase component [Gottschalkia purinilytica]|uniref:ABC-type multidrug transport system, ATPase component n=1 Tax=Gottschalkia purinilytica TaxID=1503 RepID=A0A0L0WE20_GOTPU|nr:ABC transporter ATP-binding protein [Gottschalkia purinilytica]KNF09665.1 ABC-type multidrug transport system, ATPase component [Gottschalkia purinilytica]